MALVGITFYANAGAYLGGGGIGDMSPLGAEGALLPRSAPWVEKVISGHSSQKKVNRHFHPRYSQKRSTKFPSKVFSQKRSSKIALSTGGALSVVRTLGNNVRPLGVVLVPSLADFLNTPLR